jgi:hypothetical protein
MAGLADMFVVVRGGITNVEYMVWIRKNWNGDAVMRTSLFYFEFKNGVWSDV